MPAAKSGMTTMPLPSAKVTGYSLSPITTLTPSVISLLISMLIVAFCPTVMFSALADNSLSNELTVTVAVLFSAFA